MTDYNPEKTVLVVGYPRSGNTWVARLIAEALDSPVSRFRDALPISVEGQDRPGDWFISQLHLKLVHKGAEGNALCGAWEFNVDAWKGERIILVYRDPRDVAISAKHYWELDSNRTALMAMVNGIEPLTIVGKWVDFYVPWLEFNRFNPGMVISVGYELLHEMPTTVLRLLIKGFGLKVNGQKISDTIKNQEFNTKRHEIENEFTNGAKNARPYGKTIQLKAMREGKPFQYRTEMSDEDSNYACKNFEEVMKWMGYPTI